MEAMVTGVAPRRARWYRSFYFRIAVSFVVFVVAILLAQSAIFSFVVARRAPFPGRSPNNVAAIVAADIGAALTQDPGLNLQEYVAREYARIQPLVVIMKDGRIATNRPRQVMAESLRRSVDAVLAGRGAGHRIEGPAVVMTPIQVDGELRGMAVLPPGPPGSPVGRDLGRILSVPGTTLLIVATTIAALFIFAPARRRLKALEAAAERLGAGDLAARAPEEGGDEIANVAGAFNRMAQDIAMRDDALRTVDRLRRQMLADVSHELKTPLTAMRGYVETLRMSEVGLDAATRERYFETIERETLRLDRIVQDLLDLARLEHGVGPLNARWFAIGRVFEHVIARHEHEAQACGIAVRPTIEDEADQTWADPDRIEQAIENLFANALRHTPAGGAIELAARADRDAVVLSVVDSGEGIAADHLPYVFDRFYKGDASRTNNSGGSGLGLSITKAIVVRHGGSIQVASVPGRTAFTIVLPQQPDAPSQSASTNL
jgi:two-component system OmpR family sensor kinase